MSVWLESDMRSHIERELLKYFPPSDVEILMRKKIHKLRSILIEERIKRGIGNQPVSNRIESKFNDCVKPVKKAVEKSDHEYITSLKPNRNFGSEIEAPKKENEIKPMNYEMWMSMEEIMELQENKGIDWDDNNPDVGDQLKIFDV